jgi:hypothetical protein
VGYEIVSNQVFVPASGMGSVNVACSTGNKVIGGGFALGHSAFLRLFHAYPGDGRGNLSDHNWDVFAQNTDRRSDWQAWSHAICAAVGP